MLCKTHIGICPAKNEKENENCSYKDDNANKQNLQQNGKRMREQLPPANKQTSVHVWAI